MNTRSLSVCGSVESGYQAWGESDGNSSGFSSAPHVLLRVRPPPSRRKPSSSSAGIAAGPQTQAHPQAQIRLTPGKKKVEGGTEHAPCRGRGTPAALRGGRSLGRLRASAARRPVPSRARRRLRCRPAPPRPTPPPLVPAAAASPAEAAAAAAVAEAAAAPPRRLPPAVPSLAAGETEVEGGHGAALPAPESFASPCRLLTLGRNMGKSPFLPPSSPDIFLFLGLLRGGKHFSRKVAGFLKNPHVRQRLFLRGESAHAERTPGPRSRRVLSAGSDHRPPRHLGASPAPRRLASPPPFLLLNPVAGH